MNSCPCEVRSIRFYYYGLLKIGEADAVLPFLTLRSLGKRAASKPVL